MTRVVAIGIDAVEPSLITTLIREGRLPHLEQLLARAATVDLSTASDYRAEFPWNEFCTGRRASTLRYWSTVTFDPDAYATYMRGAPDAEPFYAVGDDARVVAFDVPKVVRSSSVRGVQILGWGAHSPQYPFGSMPDGEYDALMTAFRPSPGLDIEYAGAWHQPEYLTRLADVQANAVRTRAQILRWLAARTPEWKLLLTLIGETHQLGHMTAHGFVGRLTQAPTASVARAAMITTLEAVDAAVADVVSWVPNDTTVIVFSVQGMTSADDETASSLVPEMLVRNAIGEARLPATELGPWRRRGAPPLIPAVWDDPIEWLERRFRASASATRRREAWRSARHALRRYAPAVPRARRQLMGIPEPPAPTGPSPPTEFPFRDDSLNDWIAAAWYRDAWPRLPAFAIPGFSDAQIRINLDGRERGGIVDRDDYERACDDVERVLRSCRNGATGAPLVREVHRIRADDPYAPDGPPADLIVQLHGADAIEHPELGAVGPIVTARTGGHTTNGFAFVVGPGIAPGPRGRFAVCDLSATILELLGAHPSAPLDGRPFLSSDVHT